LIDINGHRGFDFQIFLELHLKTDKEECTQDVGICWPKLKRIYVLVLFALLGVDFLVYGSSLSFGFMVQSDDMAYIYRNPYLQDLTIQNMVAIFSNIHFDSYLPVTLLTYSLDYTFWGFDATGYHLTQILLHTINAFLVFIILMLFPVSRWAAIGIALTYAVHPVQVESVVWISERKNLVSGFFVFLSILFYVLHSRQNSASFRNLTLSWGMFVLALLSKSIAVMLPLVFVLFDLCIARRGWMLVEKLPFFAGSLVVAFVTVYTQREAGAIHAYPGGTALETVMLTLRVYWDYLASLIFPFSLSPQYFYSLKVDLYDWQAYTSYVFIPGLLFAAAYNFRKRPYFTFIVGWFVLWLLPVSNIIPLSTVRQDRYMYLPSLAIMVLIFLPLLNKQWMAGKCYRSLAFCGIVLLYFASVSSVYSYSYSSDRAYWHHNAKLYPQWATAQFKAGYGCWVYKDIACAVDFYKKVLKIDPNHGLALNNLSAVLIDQGHYRDAKLYLLRALQVASDNINIYHNLILLAKKTPEDLDEISGWQKKIQEIQSLPKKKELMTLGPMRTK
jgi:hypothetical protein